jgi:hypothetical protein
MVEFWELLEAWSSSVRGARSTDSLSDMVVRGEKHGSKRLVKIFTSQVLLRGTHRGYVWRSLETGVLE